MTSRRTPASFPLLNPISPSVYTACSPPTLSLQIPLQLLGRRGINWDLEHHPEKSVKRIESIHQALGKVCPDIPIRLWVGERGAEGTVQEESRWKACRRSGAWVLGLAEEGSGALGVLGEGRRGDGMLTAEEVKVKGEKVWVCPFMLQRFDLPAGSGGSEAWEGELTRIFDVFKKLGEFEPVAGKGAVFKVAASERCWARVAFLRARPDVGADPVWDELTVGSLLMLLTAFEKEMLSLAAPTQMLEFWPLSRFLTHSAVRALREEKAVLVGRRRRRGWRDEVECKKLVDKWLEELEFEDEKRLGGEEILGESKRGWWEAVEAAKVVRESQVFKGRCAVEFQINHNARSGAGDGLDFGQAGTLGLTKGKDGILDVEDEDRHTDLRSPPPLNPLSSPLPCPPVKAISFPIPLVSQDPASHIIAHTRLLSRILLFSLETPEDRVLGTIQRLHEMRDILDETPLQTLAKLSQAVGVEDDYVRTWEEEVGKYWEAGEVAAEAAPGGDPMSLPSDGVIAGLDGGTEHSEEVPWATDPRVMEDGGVQDVFTPLMDLLESRKEKEKAYIPTFVKRYEEAGGFHVPLNTKIYELMRVEDEKRNAF